VIAYIDRILKEGAGADRQLRVFQQTGDLNKVVDYMIQETEQGIFHSEVTAIEAQR
jgi:carboxylate-amine ligase